MKQDEKNGYTNETSLTFTSDLRGRQSVRATFKLSEGCIEAISIVAAHLGIKQKSLFDHLVEDARTLRSIAREIQNIKLDKQGQGRVQKTFVISRRSLLSLEKVSKNFNAPRDALVEFSVQRLLPIIAKERKTHEKRKKMLEEIGNHLEEGRALLDRSKESLDPEDPIFQKFESVMAVYENAYHHMASFVEKGKIIEEFQPDHLKNVWIIAED
ncbi:MAG: hypothetical protein P8012_15805 [Desulfobacterales bacterium]